MEAGAASRRDANKLDIVKYLLDQGVDVSGGIQPVHPLHLAEDPRIIKLLAAHKWTRSVSAAGTPLQMAALGCRRRELGLREDGVGDGRSAYRGRAKYDIVPRRASAIWNGLRIVKADRKEALNKAAIDAPGAARRHRAASARQQAT